MVSIAEENRAGADDGGGRVSGVAAAARQQAAPLQGVPPVADPAAFAPLATRIDPYVARPRLIVLTDIANEPDDQMSFVRLLVSSNQFDIEALVATTSRHLRTKPRPDVHALGHRGLRQGPAEPRQARARVSELPTP